MPRRKDGCNQSDAAMNGRTASAWFVCTLVFPASKKGGICWLWWLIWLIQSISDTVCQQLTVQTSKDHRSMFEIGTLVKEVFFFLTIFKWKLWVISINLQVIPLKNRLQKPMTKESKVIFSPIGQSFILSYAILSVVLSWHDWKPSISILEFTRT